MHRRAGVTLLELMLVLVIIAGVLAVAWPALSRSLASSDLREAGQSVREALSDARRLAMETGEPVLVRFEPDGHTIRFDIWYQTLDTPDSTAFESPFGAENDLGSAADSGSASLDPPQLNSEVESSDAEPFVEAGSGDNRSPISHREQRVLPSHLFVVEVELNADPRAAESSRVEGGINIQTTDSNSNDFPNNSGRGLATEPRMSLPDERLDDASLEPDAQLPRGLEQGAWIWFLPQGQAPAARIRLVDTQSRRELQLSIDPWTGSMELDRDSKIDPALFATDAAPETGD